MGGAQQQRRGWGPGGLVPLPPWGCWDTADREGRDARREARLDRGKSGRRGYPPVAGGPCPMTPAAEVKGEGSGSCFFFCFFFVKCRVNVRGVKTGSPSLS